MTKISDINGEYDRAAINKLTWPIAWSGAPDVEYETARRALVEEAREALDSCPDGVAVEIKDGQIISVLTSDNSAV